MTVFIRPLTRPAKFATVLLVALSAMLTGSGTQTWEMNSYSDFVRGRFEGVSLSREGRLSLAPKVDSVFTSDQPVIWSVAQSSDGTLYAATGHRGRIYRIDATGKSSLLWTAEQPEIFAVAVDAKGAVYAGTSPDGKVYRIVNGKAEEYFNPKARYIWSLAVASDGVLFVGTGEQGRVFRVEGPGKGELYYETGQSHITGLALDPQGRLLAGTEPNGILYRITAKDKAFVLYDSAQPEIRSIVPMTDGSIYVAALGGSIAKRAQGAAQAAQGASGAPVTIATTTITVEGQAGSDIKPPEPKAPAQTASVPVAPAPAAQAVDTTGADKSAVYRINADNTVETLWTSKDENVYDLLALQNQVLFSTDQNGRIYGLAPDLRVTLVTEAGEGETTRLLASDHSILAATSNMGRILRLGDKPGPGGWYESPVHDSGTASRWGGLSWRADVPAGCGVVFRARSGNSARPDRTWSEWSAPLTDSSGARISSPNARYIQWRVELSGSGGATPLLNSVTVAYLPQNSPPVVKSINVITQATLNTPSAKGSSNSSSAAYSVTVSDTTDSNATSAGTPTQTLGRAATQQITVSWQADDPDNDRLVYSLYYRAEDETRWMLLRADSHDTSLTFDADILADGKYYFRVTASDREANAAASAREAQLVSSPVMIDNTPPAIAMGAVRRNGATAHAEWDASDASSALRRCEYSLDAGNWVPMESADGVIDSPREKFALDLANLSAGEHVLVVRVADSANNTATARVVLK